MCGIGREAYLKADMVMVGHAPAPDPPWSKRGWPFPSPSSTQSEPALSLPRSSSASPCHGGMACLAPWHPECFVLSAGVRGRLVR